jgi:hypothetical protein
MSVASALVTLYYRYKILYLLLFSPLRGISGFYCFALMKVLVTAWHISYCRTDRCRYGGILGRYAAMLLLALWQAVRP